MKAYKEKQFLVFEFENEKKVKYNLATGESIGFSGRVVKDIRTQLRGMDLFNIIESFEDEKYREFLRFIDSIVNRATGRGAWRGQRVDKIRNVGSFLKEIENFSSYEQYFSSGINNVGYPLDYKFTEIPKGLVEIIRRDNLKVTNKLIVAYTSNPDLFRSIYQMEGLYSISKSTLYNFAKYGLYKLKTGIGYRNTKEGFFVTLIKEYGYNPITLIKYLDRLKTLEALEDDKEILREIEDYARMMNRISPKYDRYPRNFLTTHKIATRNYNRLKHVFKEEDFRKRIALNLEYQDDKYVWIYPKTTQEIKDEAVKQNHCVASYIQRVIDGECHIMFMRKKDEPTKSLITMEIRGDKVTQARGSFNRDTTEEENKHLKTFKKRLERLMKND